MSSVAISGNASGAGVLTIAAPNTASSYTLTLPTATTTLVGTDATQTLTNKTLTSPTMTGAVVSTMASSVITSGTVNAGGANPLASGTVVDFTGIPSWVKRITVMFSGVSTSSTSNLLIQVGTGGTPTYVTTGYVILLSNISVSAVSTTQFTNGFQNSTAANSAFYGNLVLTNLTGNTWTGGGSLIDYTNSRTGVTNGSIALGAVLTAVRITTVNGTDTFDAGSINILYE